MLYRRISTYTVCPMCGRRFKRTPAQRGTAPDGHGWVYDLAHPVATKKGLRFNMRIYCPFDR